MTLPLASTAPHWLAVSSASIPLRALAIMALGVTSAALILYPAEFRLEFTSIQSLNAIPMLPLFAVLLFAWMGLLLVLLWSTDKLWPTLGLVVCFGIVYFSFWTLRNPYGFFETWWKMQGAQVIVASGKLEPGLMHYGEWPGLAIFGAALSNVTGRDLASMVVPVVLVVQVALPICLFAVYCRILGSTRGPALAVILAIMGNAYLFRFHFHPFWFGLVLLITGLIIISRYSWSTKVGTVESLLLLILAASLAIFHLFTGIILFSAIASIYIISQGRWFRLRSIRDPALVLVTIVVFIAFWQIVWSSRIFDRVAGYIPKLLTNVFQGDFNELFVYAGGVVGKNVLGIPFWANATRLGWLGGLYGIGMVVAVWVIWRRDEFTPQLRLASAWLLSAAATCAVAILLIKGGEEFRRFLLYGGPLAAPIIVASLYSVGQGRALKFVAVGLLVLAVPSFLINGNLVSTQRYYLEQQVAGEFLAQTTDTNEPGSGIALYNISSGAVGWYYLPFADLVSSPLLDRGYSDLREFARDETIEMVSAFTASGAKTPSRLMWIDNSRQSIYESWFGPEGAGYVLEPLDDLAGSSGRIYENGLVELWAAE